jgi:hypothetical protein
MLNVNPTFRYLLRRTAMKTLMIKDLSRDEELDRKTMAEVRGGLTVATTRSARFYPGMTEAQAIAQFVGYATSLHQYLSNQ